MDHENEETKSKVYDVLFEIHENFNTDEILIAPMDIQSISKKIHGRNPINPKEARKILKSFGLTPTDNTLTYEGFELLPHGEFVKIKRLGRYFKINFNEIRHFFDENDESLINN